MDKKKLAANCMLLLTALIWGTAFVAQRVGMEYIGPLTFTATRFFLATLLLLCVAYLTDLRKKRVQDKSGQEIVPLTLPEKKKRRKTLITAGSCCGTVLFCASFLQQQGLVFTTASKTSFITALYILLVPLFGIFLKQRIGLKGWIGVAIGTVGLYLLCITESFSIAKGDFIVLIGAFFWACHVLIIDHFLPSVDAIKLAAFQFGVCSVLSGIGMFLFENPSINAILDCAFPIVYAGVFSGGIGFTLQIIGQKNTSPTVASLLLSMEAVFGAISGFLLLHEILSMRELTGCAFMFAAIILSQLPDKKEIIAQQALEEQ